MSSLAEGFSPTPFWWEDAPPSDGTDETPPARTDFVVIGAGVTGLHAALEAARNGADVTVLDAERIGHGASTRNNGTIVPYLYLKQYQLEKKFGKQIGAAIARTAVTSIQFLMETCETHGIDAKMRSFDRYFLALTEAHRAALEKSAKLQAVSGIDTGWNPITNAELVERTGYRGFYGGIHSPNAMSMHPGCYMAGIANACREAGVRLVSRCRVLGMSRTVSGFALRTERGSVAANQVILATNGYSGPEFSFAHKSLMRIPLHMAATEPLPEELRRRHFPEGRLLVDSKTNITWIRSSPDGARLLVGGRAGMSGSDPERSARTLHADMVRILPDLAPLRMTHAWHGMTAFPMDLVPHVGSEDGIHYALGFCGVGMTVGGWLGNRLARKVLGLPAETHQTPFDNRPLRRQPFPGFLDMMARTGLGWINTRDWLETRKR